MHQACDAGALNVCQWLLNHGAASTIRSKDSEGWTPMFRACECGHILIAQVFFDTLILGYCISYSWMTSGYKENEAIYYESLDAIFCASCCYVTHFFS